MSQRVISRPRVALAAAALALLAAGEAGAQAEKTPVRGGTLVYSVSVGETDTYDCHATLGVSVIHRVGPHYSTLLTYDLATYPKIIGDLAEAWTVSPDGLRYEFTLRGNVRFHDGTPFGAADIKATYERLRNPPDGVVSIRRSQFQDIAAIDTPDERHVVFRLARPNSSMLAVFANPYNCVYSARRLAEGPKYPQRTVMGTGPFKFVEHVVGAEWRAERFDGYFRPGRPYLDGFRAINLDPPGMVNALVAGQVATDFRGVSPAQADRIAAARGDKTRILETVSANMIMLTINARRKPFDDVRVRRALALTVDHAAGAGLLAKQDIFQLPGGFQRPGSPYARSAAELEAMPGFGRDPAAARAEARRLLAEAGVANLKAVILNRALYAPQGVVLIDQFRQIGIEVTQELPENQRFFAAYGGGNYDFVVNSFQAFPEEPLVSFAAFQSFDKNPNNKSYANDAQLDAIYDRIAATLDPAERKRAVQEFEKRLFDQGYAIPLYWAKRFVPVASEMRGFVATPNYMIGDAMAEIWLDR